MRFLIANFFLRQLFLISKYIYICFCFIFRIILYLFIP